MSKAVTEATTKAIDKEVMECEEINIVFYD